MKQRDNPPPPEPRDRDRTPAAPEQLGEEPPFGRRPGDPTGLHDDEPSAA